MSEVSIFYSETPETSDDIGIMKLKIQHRRTDPEAILLKEFETKTEDRLPHDVLKQVINEYCQKLGGISDWELVHKLEIFYGLIDDDEREWREEKYGKQEL